jgi:alpha-glucosidase
MDLIEEIQQNMDLYSVLYPLAGLANNLLHSLAWFAPTAPTQHWMDSMTLGCVIASRYNLVLHTFEINASGCFTHLPLRSPPVAVRARREIAIARIGQHFVQVFLRPHYPVPPIPVWWWQNASDEAKGWATRYTVRLNLWSEVMGGGNID